MSWVSINYINQEFISMLTKNIFIMNQWLYHCNSYFIFNKSVNQILYMMWWLLLFDKQI